jgi:2-dehydropantoate 2-reductase
MNRPVAILGPGAVGGSLAVRLSNAGQPVICVAHAEAAGLIALAGLVVESPEGTSSARMEVVEQLAKPVGLLLVTVKAPALEDAIQRVDPEAVADGAVIPLLNGLEHMDKLRERFGDRVAAGSISHFHA